MKVISLRRDNRKCLEAELKKVGQGSKVVDIGCGKMPLRSVVVENKCSYIGVDIEDGFYSSCPPDVIGSAYDVPLDLGSADVVLSSHVFEHLNQPEKAFDVTYHLLKNEGLFILSVPFLYPIHAKPNDYMRYTKYLINDLAVKTGFKVCKITEIGGFWYCVGLYLRLYLQSLDSGILRKIRVIGVFINLLQLICLVFHHCEGWVYSLVGRGDVSRFRESWCAAYVFVLKK